MCSIAIKYISQATKPSCVHVSAWKRDGELGRGAWAGQEHLGGLEIKTAVGNAVIRAQEKVKRDWTESCGSFQIYQRHCVQADSEKHVPGLPQAPALLCWCYCACERRIQTPLPQRPTQLRQEIQPGTELLLGPLALPPTHIGFQSTTEQKTEVSGYDYFFLADLSPHMGKQSQMSDFFVPCRLFPHMPMYI